MTDLLKAAHLETRPRTEADIDLRWKFVDAVGLELGYLPDMLCLTPEEALAIEKVGKEFNAGKQFSVRVRKTQTLYQ